MNNKKILNHIEKDNGVNLLNIFLCSLIVAGLIVLVDIYNIPSSYIVKNPLEAVITIIFLIFIIVLFIIRSIYLMDIFKLTNLKIIDKISIYVVLINVICAFVWTYWLPSHCIYKWIIPSILVLISGTIFFVKRLYEKKIKKNKDEKQKNIYDLKDVYEGKVEIHTKTPILITEKDVDYDLLNRGGIISQLYNSIVASCNSDSSFVIGLEGEWGSGKTTIINNVMAKFGENSDFIIINDFDPWMFGTQNALLEAIYNSILLKLGISYRKYHSRKIIKSLSNTLAERYKAGELVDNIFFTQQDDYEETKEKKKWLEQYIKENNKKIVFSIDNLERADGDNIIFLLRMIGTFFELPNVVYILSYDRNRLEEILKDTREINPKYIEKIVNQEVKVPIIQQEQLEKFYSICLSNIMISYGMEKDEILKLKFLMRFISNKARNLRVFKRMINSAFSNAFCQNNILYIRDLLGLEVLRFLQPELYYLIYRNRNYFVSHDRDTNEDLYRASLDKKRFNVDGKNFFEDFFKKYEDYKQLLSEMFPYVERYVNSGILIPEYLMPDHEYKEISRNKRICSNRYFDLYFSYGNNDYLKTEKEMSDLIDAIAKENTEDVLYKLMCSEIASIPKSIQREWFERFENYLDLIHLEKRVIVAQSIFDCLDTISTSQIFMGLDAKTRALLNLELLLEETPLDDFQKFVKNLEDKYEKLYMIDKILYWFQHTHSQNVIDVKERENILREKFSEMCEKVIRENINIYTDSYYARLNVWGLIRYLKINENREEIVQSYISKVVNEDTVFRVLGDIVAQSVGNGYGYRIDEDNFKIFFRDESILDNILENVIPQNESEKFVLKLYQVYKSNEIDIWGRKETMLADEFSFDL